MLKFYTLPYLCCNATSPRVKIWATSSCVGQSPAATQPKTPHSSPIPDSSNSIFISLSVNLTERGSSVSAISACPCVSALRRQGSNTCHSKRRSLKLNKLNWNRLSCCKKKECLSHLSNESNANRYRLSESTNHAWCSAKTIHAKINRFSPAAVWLVVKTVWCVDIPIRKKRVVTTVVVITFRKKVQIFDAAAAPLSHD